MGVSGSAVILTAYGCENNADKMSALPDIFVAAGPPVRSHFLLYERSKKMYIISVGIFVMQSPYAFSDLFTAMIYHEQTVSTTKR